MTTDGASIGEIDRLEQRRRDAIDAAFVRIVYDASRAAEMQRTGLLPLPKPSVADYKLLRRVEARRLGLDPAEIRESLAPAVPEMEARPALTGAPASGNVIGLMDWLEASVVRASRDAPRAAR